MPLILLIGGAALFGWLVSRERRAAQLSAAVPPRPPTVYVGDEVFALPQERWGVVECIARSGDGYRYGVRLRNGLAVVRRDHELVR